jgi:hypothetical protein
MSSSPGRRSAATTTRSCLALRTGMALSDLDLDHLWMAYACGGGQLSVEDLDRVLTGHHRLSDHEHDIVAAALNDHLLGLGLHQPVAYAADISPGA